MAAFGTKNVHSVLLCFIFIDDETELFFQKNPKKHLILIWFLSLSYLGLKIIINALLNAVKQLAEVMTLTIFCLMVFALFALQVII